MTQPTLILLMGRMVQGYQEAVQRLQGKEGERDPV